MSRLKAAALGLGNQNEGQSGADQTAFGSNFSSSNLREGIGWTVPTKDLRMD